MTKNKLIKLFKLRLGTLNKNWKDDELDLFLELAGYAFDMLPPITFDTIDSVLETDDDDFCKIFVPVLLNYAMYLAISSRLLSSEEDSIQMNEQAQFELIQWREQVLLIKNNSDFFTGSRECECEDCKKEAKEKAEAVKPN